MMGTPMFNPEPFKTALDPADDDGEPMHAMICKRDHELAERVRDATVAACIKVGHRYLNRDSYLAVGDCITDIINLDLSAILKGKPNG